MPGVMERIFGLWSKPKAEYIRQIDCTIQKIDDAIQVRKVVSYGTKLTEPQRMQVIEALVYLRNMLNWHEDNLDYLLGRCEGLRKAAEKFSRLNNELLLILSKKPSGSTALGKSALKEAKAKESQLDQAINDLTNGLRNYELHVARKMGSEAEYITALDRLIAASRLFRKEFASINFVNLAHFQHILDEEEKMIEREESLEQRMETEKQVIESIVKNGVSRQIDILVNALRNDPRNSPVHTKLSYSIAHMRELNKAYIRRH